MSRLATLVHRAASVVRVHRSNRRVRQAMAAGRDVLDFGPTSLNLMMADVCNSQCIMCGHDYKACGTGDMLTLDKWKTICGHLDMHSIVDVIYGGGGEPFMNRDLPAIAEHTHALDPVIQHTVITNLIQGDEDAYRRLIRQRVHFLCSLNAATPETFKAVAGTDRFEQCVANLRTILRLRREERASIDVSISMILMKRNVGELSDFVRLAAAEGANSVKTLYVRVYPDEHRRRANDNAPIQASDSLFHHQAESDRTIREAAALALSLGVGFDHEPLFCEARVCARRCPEAWKSLFINFNGDAYPCPASEILFMKKISSGQYDSGNILRQEVMDFWNNAFWRAVRRTNLHPGHGIVPECLCCGNAMNWDGPRSERSHVMNWDVARNSTLKL